MKTSSRKAKGRWLQNYVLKELVRVFGFTEDDIRTAIMGETGADVKLTKKARQSFPYSIECKNQQAFSGVYKAYEQATGHGDDEPLLVLKMNRKPVLAVVRFDHFLGLYNDKKKNV